MDQFNLIIICGPPASGKMTVGQELKKITGLKLFYNHLSLELVNQFFDFGTPSFSRLDRKIRFDVFREVAKSDLNGLIFTMAWAFSEQDDEDYVDEIISVFDERKATVHIIELDCEQEERLRRNKTENRLKHKPTKRNLEFSEKLLKKEDTLYRMNTLKGELPTKKIWKINNTSRSAKEVAEMIASKYDLRSKNIE